METGVGSGLLFRTPRKMSFPTTPNRHPLQELCVEPFFANSTELDEQHGLMTLLTGPNASGKVRLRRKAKEKNRTGFFTIQIPCVFPQSVYIKQVALIVLLAHTGRLA